MNRYIIIKFAIAVLFVLLVATLASSQNKPRELSENEKLSIIQKAVSLLHENYVFPERVERIGKNILSKFNSGGYAASSTSEDFLSALNHDLEKESGDTHVNISFGPERVQQIIEEKKNEGKTIPLTKEWLERLRYENYRLRKVERLDGNIGYFWFLNFADLQAAKESIVGAMNFISNSNAIILDLRENGGGSSETLLFMLSYFLPDGLKIGDFHYRKNNRIEEIKIPSDLAIKKIPDSVPLYLLVSNKTSSAAEGMASVLQSCKRAVVVGETTKGEGNPGELFVINDMLYIMIPTAISKSTVSEKESVEGVGVTPDIIIAPEKSFDKAMLEICRTLSQNAQAKELKTMYEWQMPVWENTINPLPTPLGIKNNIVGNFKEERQIIFDDGNYFYINKEKLKIRLTYFGNNVFAMEGKQFVRLRIPVAETPISYFEFFWDDGFVEKIERVN